MPIVEMPDGVRVSFPDDMPKEQIRDMIASKFPELSKEQVAPQGAGAASVYGFNTAIPFGGRITSALGAGMAKAMGAEQPFGELYDEAQALGRATMEESPIASGLGSLAGIAGTLPLAATRPAQAVGSFVRGDPAARGAMALGGKALRGAAVSAPVGALYGAGEAEDMAEGALQGGAISGAIGGGIPVVGAGVRAGGRALKPSVDEGMRELGLLAKRYKIPLSVDQLTGSRAIKATQKVSQDLPFSGQEAFRDKQLSAWNKGIFKTVGMDADKFTPKNMDEAFKKVGKEFDNFAKGKVFNVAPLQSSIKEIAEDAGGYASQDALKNFEFTASKILREAAEDGSIKGEKLNMLRSMVNKLGRKAGAQDTKEILFDLENAIIETMTAGDDAAARAFSSTKQKYKNLLAIEPLAAKAKGGNISPTLLNNRVGKIYGRSFVRGQAGEIGDLAKIGFELLPELGGSDTQARQMIEKILGAAGSVGAATVNAPATIGGLAGNRALQEFVNRNPRVVDAMLREVSTMNPSQAKQVMDFLGVVGTGRIAAEGAQ